MRVGIDVGGTFTDVVAVDKHANRFFYAKTPTTHHDLAEGVLNGLEEILEKAGKGVGEIEYLIHGTTLGTNAIVEGKGARVGLITTKGFEDVLEIRRVARPKEAAFDFEADNPPPLVPRYLRKGVAERVDSKGRVYLLLEEDSAREVIEFFKGEQVESVAVCLLFSFLNPAHEQRIGQICRDLFPEALISLSSEVCPEFREYERTCTTVMNAYLAPVIKRYMDNLIRRLRERYGELKLHIMQSNGGLTTAQAAGDHAAHLINSGPAAGAIAAAFISEAVGCDMGVGADMGGTTFDISIVDRGLPKTTTWGGVTEYPIKLPMVDLKTIGAGGGSIAWIDQGGVLYVGPQSAGSNPGPACYGWGGTLPTVTDANVVLGRLNPRFLLGGKMRIYPERAREAIQSKVAERIGLSVEEAALSIVGIANANMVKGIGGVTVQRGYDLREFILVPFGGAAGNHAVEIAAALGIAKIVIPSMCGNLSAFGLLVADMRYDDVRTLARKKDEISPGTLLKLFREMEESQLGRLREQGVRDEDTLVEWSADLRYEGQSWELNAPVQRTSTFGPEELQALLSTFHDLHQRAYSYSEPGEAVEFVNLRVKAVGRHPDLQLPRRACSGKSADPALKERRPVYFKEKGFVETPVFERDQLGYGTEICGPCLIEEEISSTLVPLGSQLSVDEYGNLVILVDGVENQTELKR